MGGNLIKHKLNILIMLTEYVEYKYSHVALFLFYRIKKLQFVSNFERSSGDLVYCQVI